MATAVQFQRQPSTTCHRAQVLDRAYVQGRVIETNLKRLCKTLRQADSRLGANAEWYTTLFGEFAEQLQKRESVPLV